MPTRKSTYPVAGAKDSALLNQLFPFQQRDRRSALAFIPDERSSTRNIMGGL